MNISVFQIGMLLLHFHRLITARKYAMGDFYAVRGENISFICQLINTGSLFTLSWRLNGGLIVLHDPLIHGEEISTGSFSSIISNNGTNLELLVSNVQFGDAGLYSCTKDFRSSGLPVSWFWNLNVQDVPKITIKKSVFIEKAAVLAECCVEFSLTWADRNITWLINGNFSTAITTSLPKTSPSAGNSERVCSTVTFQSSRLHNGKYLQCLAENKLNLSSSIPMTVNYPSKVKVLSSKYLIVMMNSTINITCAAEGYPLPSVGLQFNGNGDIWYNVPLKPVILSSTEATLTSSFLFAFTRRMGSVFRCKAFNTIGSTAVSKEVTTDVYSPAEVEMISVSPIVIDNSYILIECRASGVPPPDIHLQNALTSGTWVTLPLQPLQERGALVWIFNVSQENLADGSSYRCTANSTLDNVTISSSVIVQFRC
ncbi:Hemicentin-2 [Holothuria leucospilota]|uniref:Hemicentin-2 n=1 Tax=Holothuria leucospilota TaxID=206669 RepID=A0A9Q1BBL9_HOLLE|nr:Hemicentin-2 [Holothuria leucospilota]